ncbi:hypothetical protein [Nocardia sp. BMG111209]|uniref:hypothetical protein n=1 Tax=Nocardia sp. BMG111209 TaxID=1160137 RepID=UPI0003A4FE80|nr:hypothetical protein [Nocardia sp. BMG111209]
MVDDQSSGSAGSSEIAELRQRVATARGKLPLQTDPALLEAMSDSEIAAERELAEWIRAQRRQQRRRAVSNELASEQRDRKVADSIRRSDEADAHWHRRALAARRRVSSPDARLAQLFRRAEWSSRALIAVVVLGMIWAGVNVQHNLVPSGNMADPLYWLSYGFEAMISIPIITIMVVTTTAARWGRDVARGKVVLLEIGLLSVTIALNAGPHIAAGRMAHAAEAAVAPIMVGVIIWLHAWVAARYATLIDGAPVVDAHTGPVSTQPWPVTVSPEQPDLSAHHISHSPVTADDHGPTRAATAGHPGSSPSAAEHAPAEHLPIERRNGSGRTDSIPMTELRVPVGDPVGSPSHNGRNGRNSAESRNGHSGSNGHTYNGFDTRNGHPVRNGHDTGTGRNGHDGLNVLGVNGTPAARNGYDHADGPVANNGHRKDLGHNGHDIHGVGGSSNGYDHTEGSIVHNGRRYDPGHNGHDLADAGDSRNGYGQADGPVTHNGHRNELGHNGYDLHDAGAGHNGGEGRGDHNGFDILGGRNGIRANDELPGDGDHRDVSGSGTGESAHRDGNRSSESDRNGREGYGDRNGRVINGGNDTHGGSADTGLAADSRAVTEPAPERKTNGHTYPQAEYSVADSDGPIVDVPAAPEFVAVPARPEVPVTAGAQLVTAAAPAATSRSAARAPRQPEPAALPGLEMPARDERPARKKADVRPAAESERTSRRERNDRPAADEAPAARGTSEPAARRRTAEASRPVTQPLPIPADTLYADSDDFDTDIAEVEIWAVARDISQRGMSRLPVEQLVEILTFADQSWTPAAIGAEVGMSGSAVLRILEAARRLRAAAYSG